VQTLTIVSDHKTFSRAIAAVSGHRGEGKIYNLIKIMMAKTP